MTGRRSWRRTLGALSCAACLAGATPAMASARGWDDASSIGRDVLAAAALGLPLAHGDMKGVLQAGGSMGVAELSSLGLKEAFPEWRPDHSDRKSFPSGHAALSFAGAASLQNRYGWKVGIPAQLLAVFVGVGRVKARKHHWYDVVAGAAIGEASGFLLTSRRNGNVRVLPWGDSHGGGFALAAAF